MNLASSQPFPQTCPLLSPQGETGESEPLRSLKVPLPLWGRDLGRGKEYSRAFMTCYDLPYKP